MKNKANKDTVYPKQQRAIESKKTILRSATEIFAEKGLYGARIDEIADSANVNKQRIYAYFGSKEKLYRQVLINVYSNAAKSENITKLKEKQIPEMTKILLETFFDFHKNNPLFWRLLVWENLNGGKSLSNDDWQNIQSSYTDHIKALYYSGQKQGVFQKNIEFTTYMLMIFSVSFFYYSNQITISHLLNLKIESHAYIKKLIEQINNIVCKGIF
jgi:TetR/AcrR family transcriptional regulator